MVEVHDRTAAMVPVLYNIVEGVEAVLDIPPRTEPAPIGDPSSGYRTLAPVLAVLAVDTFHFRS